MKYLKLFEDYNKSDFIFFYKKLMKNIQTKRVIDYEVFTKGDVLNTIIDIDNNLVKIKKGKHIINVKPSKLFDETDENKLEQSTNIIKAYNIKDKITFKELNGDNCQKYFQSGIDHKNKSSGYLKVDCMGKKEAQNYFKIIEKNPEVISVLYSFRNGLPTNNNLSGFCLLFHKNGKTYYDRIYGYNIEDEINLEKYCVEHNYINLFYKEVQKINLKIQLKEWIFEEYPYLDTMKYLDLKNGVLSNHLNLTTNRVHTLKLTGTDGLLYLPSPNLSINNKLNFIYNNFNDSMYDEYNTDTHYGMDKNKVNIFLRSKFVNGEFVLPKKKKNLKNNSM